jgi:hypothetical protein
MRLSEETRPRNWRLSFDDDLADHERVRSQKGETAKYARIGLFFRLGCGVGCVRRLSPLFGAMRRLAFGWHEALRVILTRAS